jgi:putative spermidine/putrescine transport system permease protein
MSDAANGQVRGAPLLLSSPAILLFAGFLAVPLALTLMLSFHVFDGMRGIQPTLTLKHYLEVFTDGYYYELFLRTAWMSLCVTAICVVIGVPETLIISRMRPAWRGTFFVVILGPLLVSVVVRTLGWEILFGRKGPINDVLVSLHLVDGPFRLMFSMTGIIIVLVHVLLPFMIIAMWGAVQKLDKQVAHAARSLGASSEKVFFRITLPQLMPGLLSGAIVVFTLSASAFATPAIIGGRRVKVVTTAIYDEFLNSMNWPMGAAIAVLLLIGIVCVVVGSNRLVERRFKQVFS